MGVGCRVSESDAVTPGQRVAVMILLGCRGDVTAEAEFVLSSLVVDADPSRNVTLATMTDADWRKLREYAWPGWRINDWTVSDECTRHIATARRQYAENVLGQGTLFGSIGGIA